jgi:hypothetical protein|tara:strand:- start:1169 stop:1288 length:120 start_codon:yes stop_codon:yes gene_type:complete
MTSKPLEHEPSIFVHVFVAEQYPHASSVAHDAHVACKAQ